MGLEVTFVGAAKWGFGEKLGGCGGKAAACRRRPGTVEVRRLVQRGERAGDKERYGNSGNQPERGGHNRQPTRLGNARNPKNHFEKEEETIGSDDSVQELVDEFRLTVRKSENGMVYYRRLHSAIEFCLSRGAVPKALEILDLMEANMKYVRMSTYAIVARRLAEFSEVELLEAMIMRMWDRNDEKSLPDERMCALAANAAFSSNRADIAIRILDRMPAEGVAVGSLTFSIMAKGYGRMGQPLAVTDILDRAKTNKLHLDVVAWNSAIDAYIRCGQLDTAHDLFKDMKGANVQPNETSFNTLIKGAGNAGKIDMAFDFLSEMRREGCNPNHVTKNSLIEACMRVGLWDRACDILETMIGNRHERRHAVIGYTSVCAGLVRVGKVTEALGLMNEMPKRGVEPDAVTFNSMIKAVLSVGRIQTARDLFEAALQEFGDRPDTYETMVIGLCRDGRHSLIAEAESLLSYVVSTVTWNAVINGYARIGRPDEAERVLENMKRSPVVPDVVSYTTIVSAYGKLREIEQALQVFQSMCEENIAPDLIAFNALIASFVRSGNLALAIQIFDEMALRRGAITPDLRSYSTLVQAQLYDGFNEAAWELFDHMRKGGLKPNERMLDSMMKVSLESERYDAESFHRILDEMKQLGYVSAKIQSWKNQIDERSAAERAIEGEDGNHRNAVHETDDDEDMDVWG